MSMPIKSMLIGGGGSSPSDPVSIDSGTYTHLVIDPSNATCTFEFQSDGDCAVSSGVTPTPTDWYAGAPIVGVGADYEISWDSGGSWEAFTSNRTVSRGTVGTSSTTYGVRIRRAIDSVQVASGTITLVATVDA